MHAVEQELGLSHGLLKQWKRPVEQDGEQAFPGDGKLKAGDAELRQAHKPRVNSLACTWIKPVDQCIAK